LQFKVQDLWSFFYCLWASKYFFCSTFNTFKATKITRIDFEMSKICSYEMKGVIVWIRLIKPVCNLKFKIFGHCLFVFEPQKHFIVLHFAHASHKIHSNWFLNEQICFYEVKGVIIWFRLIKLVCDVKFKIFNHCSIVFEP
jgi:hypothetical protein